MLGHNAWHKWLYTDHLNKQNMLLSTLSLTYELELDAIYDRSHAEDERSEAGEDDHGIKWQEEVIIFIS